jgi:hypothetical protein
LDQCKNLRRVYDELVTNYLTTFPASNHRDAYEALTAAKSKTGTSPAETLLRAANFTYMKKPNTSEYVGTMYPHVRAFCLKDKQVWKQFERLMTAYQKAEIPHPFMEIAIEDMDKLFKEQGKKGCKTLTTKVTSILKRYR